MKTSASATYIVIRRGVYTIGSRQLTPPPTLGYHIGLPLFSFQYYIYVKPPLLEHSPKISLPNPEKDPKWYGEVMLQYPFSRTVSTLRFSYLFKARCEMMSIVNKASNYLFQSKSECATLSSDQLLEYMDEYEQWFSGLPSSLKPANIVYSAELQLQ
jgi:hypothetical protein